MKGFSFRHPFCVFWELIQFEEGEKLASIEGYVERIIFHNEENGYSVLSVISGGKESCLVGTFPNISEGEYISAVGDIIIHPLYGEQLRVESYEFVAPSDAAGIERYLASGAIKGIGAAMAARIVKNFGDDTFRIIEEEPERLAEVKGISERKAHEIASQVSEKRDGRKALIFLQQYGITLNLAAKIYTKYGQEVYGIIKQNPYRLADDITGVGFKMADEIARNVGIHTDSDFRIRSGLFYALVRAVGHGHTYLPLQVLLQNTSELLQVEVEAIEKHVMDMVMDRKLVIRENDGEKMAYSSSYYYKELNTAKMLHDLNIHDNIPQNHIEKKIRTIEDESNIALDEMQRMAVIEAVNNGLVVITGGPGTGKTTTINTIIRYFEREGLDILLGAPTGRAAKRMTEATGFEAQTIHRLLEVNGAPSEDEVASFFTRNDENPLEADVIIIDEMSMVDINLMHALLKAITVGTRLILVGDVNQLPSVGPGNVLKDIIASNCFHVVMLTKIFRQAAESEIIRNAHKINAGERVEPNKHSKDFLFIHRDNPQSITGATITLVKEKLPGYVGAKMHDIQVMTPMRKGALGVEQLNVILQQYLNPPDKSKAEKNFSQGIFREGDKVMQIKNNYQKEWEIISRYQIPVDKGIGVFNGDMGVIKEINLFSEELIVAFDEGRLVTYSFKECEELELAYAVTIHKSQGSEYPAVVIPLLSGPRMLMNRNLLYTAVTRAKTCVCVVGSEATFQAMIKNEQEQRRYSSLDDRIKELVPELEEVEIREFV